MGDSNINEAITSTDNDVSYVTPEQFGAVGNGVNDDTEALKAMFSAAQTSGQQVVLKGGSTYLISEELEYTVAKVDFNGNWATIKVANSVKSEGELVISGSKGYAYVPAPWWKTDYFEIRYENLEDTKKYFYQLDGEGIRYMLVAFVKSIELGKNNAYINFNVSKAICKVMEDFENNDVNTINKY